VQLVFTILLIGVLGAAVVSIAVLGIRQHLRASALARRAHELSLHFAPEDSFDVPRRYAGYAMLGGGHSPRADNATYGRMRGLPVRAFDFRYEVGHGTRRLTRSYSVIVVETEAVLSPLLMWNDRDADNAPIGSRLGDGQCLGWTYRGSAEAAEKVAECCGHIAGSGLSVQFRAGAMMFCFPIRRRRDSYVPWLAEVPGLIDCLELAAPPHESRRGGQNGHAQAVEMGSSP